MKNLKNKIEELNITISKIEDEKYKDIFSSISDIVSGLSVKVEEVMVNQTALAENFNYMDEDISDIQEELFEEVSIEDLEDLEEEYKEINCISCGKILYIEESALEDGNVQCPYCNENII